MRPPLRQIVQHNKKGTNFWRWFLLLIFIIGGAFLAFVNFTSMDSATSESPTDQESLSPSSLSPLGKPNPDSSSKMHSVRAEVPRNRKSSSQTFAHLPEQLIDQSVRRNAGQEIKTSLVRLNSFSNSQLVLRKEELSVDGQIRWTKMVAADRMTAHFVTGMRTEAIAAVNSFGGKIVEKDLGPGWVNIEFETQSILDFEHKKSLIKASSFFTSVVEVELMSLTSDDSNVQDWKDKNAGFPSSLQPPNDTYMLMGEVPSILAGGPVGQWPLNNTGLTCVHQRHPANANEPRALVRSGRVGADIDAFAAWKLSADVPDLGPTGDCSSLEIAVLDSGVDTTHPDLADNLTLGFAPTNTSYLGGDGPGPVWRDEQGHGTHVAGIIAAKGNDGRGTSGVCWKARIVPIRICNGNLCGVDSVTQGLNWINQNRPDVKIINMSLTGTRFYEPYYLALRTLRDRGVIVVAAAGNGNSAGTSVDIDVEPRFPASYSTTTAVIGKGEVPANLQGDLGPIENLGNIVPVGATNCVGDLWQGNSLSSNYGVKTVKITAPGDYILSTHPARIWDQSKTPPSYENSGLYRAMSGTSQATPYVSGALAYFWSRAGNQNLTYLDVIAALYGSADRGMRGADASESDSLSGKIENQRRLNLRRFLGWSRTAPRFVMNLDRPNINECWPQSGVVSNFSELLGSGSLDLITNVPTFLIAGQSWPIFCGSSLVQISSSSSMLRPLDKAPKTPGDRSLLTSWDGKKAAVTLQDISTTTCVHCYVWNITNFDWENTSPTRIE